MQIEAATEEDLDQILQLQKKAFHDQAVIYNDFTLPPLMQTIDDLKKEFTQKKFYKVEQEGKIIASVRCNVKENTLYVEKLIVDPQFQNKQIGTRIMIAIETIYAGSVDRYALFTGHKSLRNLHLYSKLGYREIRREMVKDDLTLIYMEKMTAKSDT